MQTIRYARARRNRWYADTLPGVCALRTHGALVRRGRGNSIHVAS